MRLCSHFAFCLIFLFGSASCSSLNFNLGGRAPAAADNFSDFIEKCVDHFALKNCETKEVSEKAVRSLIKNTLVDGFKALIDLNPKIQERVYRRLNHPLEITCSSLDDSDFVSYGGATQSRLLARTRMSLPFVLDGLTADLPELSKSFPTIPFEEFRKTWGERIKAPIFHEFLHFLKFSTVKNHNHPSEAEKSEDAIYACTAQAFPSATIFSVNSTTGEIRGNTVAACKTCELWDNNPIENSKCSEERTQKDSLIKF